MFGNFQSKTPRDECFGGLLTSFPQGNMIWHKSILQINRWERRQREYYVEKE